ncbi:MAG: DUF6141 family protein [Bacteroidales bacterium]|nr:DUF6141 family protein [Bacteroidales bacterium]
MKKIRFNEVQKFRQKWLWVILLIIFGIWAYGFIQQIILKIPFGNNPASDITYVLIGIIPVGFLILFIRLRLITEINKDGIYFKLSPLQFKFKKITPDEIKDYEIRKYNAIKEYGGWGIRYGFKKRGMAYNVSGNTGMQLELKNGKKILIGTQKPDELKKAIDKLKDSFANSSRERRRQ